jgi:hypothetical protein
MAAAKDDAHGAKTALASVGKLFRLLYLAHYKVQMATTAHMPFKQ